MNAVSAKIFSVEVGADNALFIVDYAECMVYVIHSKNAYYFPGWVYVEPVGMNILEYLTSISADSFLKAISARNCAHEDLEKEQPIILSAVLKARRHGKSKNLCRKAYDFVENNKCSASLFLEKFPALFSSADIESCFVYYKTNEDKAMKALFIAFQNEIRKLNKNDLKTA